MIQVLGVKRVMIILALVTVNVVWVAGHYMALVPAVMTQRQKDRTIGAEIASLRGDISRMEMEFKQLEEQKAEFQALERDGFFRNQSRRIAEKAFQEIQKGLRVSSAKVSISAGTIEDSEEALKAKYKVLKSDIAISLEAIDDIDIFRYLYLVEAYFPGYLAVSGFELRREADISGTVLRSIAAGVNPNLAQAKINMIWRTMIPEAEIINAEGQQ